MDAADRFPLVAVDIGNTRMKLGVFAARPSAGLPEPARTLELHSHDDSLDQLFGWLDSGESARHNWWIGSVNRPAAARLLDWIKRNFALARTVELTAADLPLAVSLAHPDQVGIDRLLNALGANALRAKGEPAIVVDLGTAITVDRVSPDGAFEGGAILPGIGLAARGLHEFTDLLPLSELVDLAEPPPVLGDSTAAALRSGLYWGAVGGIREVVRRLSAESGREPKLFLTGGAAPAVAGLLSPSAVYVPHLTLGGIALAALKK